MKRLTFLILGTLLASNASADGWRADRNQFRVFEEIKAAYQVSHNKRHADKQNVDKRYTNQRHDSKQNHGKNRSDGNRGRYSYDQNHNRGDRTDNRHGEQHQSRHWQTVSAFRGRSGKVVTRQFRVGEMVNALSIESTKRGMVIHQAHALLGNGRWVRLEGLEGHIRDGERARHRLHNSRFVRRVELEVGPGRYKRGYGQLQVSSAR